MSNVANAHPKSDHSKVFDRDRTSRPRHRRYIRRIDRSIANVPVRAAIKSGNLDRLKAALQEGTFDG